MDRADDTYSTPARLLHWVTAVLVLALISVGFLMVQDGLGRTLQNRLFIFHKNVGVLVLVIVVLRLLYRWRVPAPPLPDHLPAWQRRAAGASHGLLYVLLVAMPVAGYVRVKAGGFPIESLDAMGIPSLVPRSDALASAAQTAHYFGAFALSALIFAHFAGAMHHALVRRDGIFYRMWPPVRRSAT